MVTSSTKETCSVRSLSSAAELLGESGPGGEAERVNRALGRGDC